MNRKLKKLYKNNSVIIDLPDEEDAVYNLSFEIGAIVGGSFDWSPWLPIREEQKGTQFCTCFSRLNCAETKAKKENNEELNLSDLDLGVKSGTTNKGNNLNNPSEAFRKQGIVKETDRPWKPEWLDNPNKYWNEILKSPTTPNAKLYFGGNHSWVYGKQAMLNALKDSPLQIAVGVGNNWGAGIIKDPKTYFSYHAVMCYGIDENGNYLIEDSYPPHEKVLDKDYTILQCKSFTDLPKNWKEQRDKYLMSIQAVFGPTWTPAKIFFDKKLIQRGIYGACRIVGSSAIPPYRVFLIGPGGYPIYEQKQFKELFNTLYQDGIVGIITPEQGKLLGITAGVIEQSLPITLKNSFLISLWRKITW